MTTTATDLTWQEAEAQQRFQLIDPLLQKDLDSATKTQLRQQLADAIRSLHAQFTGTRRPLPNLAFKDCIP